MLLEPPHAAVPLPQRYVLKAVLGRGSFAVTRLAVERATGRHFAVKSVAKRGLTADERRRVRREVECMHHLTGHPNVIRLDAALEDGRCVHLVEELASGGSLLARVAQQGALPEAEVVRLMRGILSALAFAHELGVVHRDVKIDNCLLSDASPEATVKLCDWGYSKFLKPGERLHKLCGTAHYLAPEVIAGDYDARADVWSAGVVAYALLAGRLPFVGATQQDVIDTVASPERGAPDLTSDPWFSLSPAARDAVAAMLTRDPTARPTAREMLRHPWLRAGGAKGSSASLCSTAAAAGEAAGSAAAGSSVHSTVALLAGQQGGGEQAAEADQPQPVVLSRIRSFGSMQRLKKHAALYIARHLPHDQMAGLAALFDALDRDHTGKISAADLRQALAEQGSALSEEELRRLLDAADLHGEGALDFGEFVAAALHQSRLQEEGNMKSAFEHFDRGNDGAISPTELCAVLRADGDCPKPPTLEEARSILRSAVDCDGSGTVDWKEFKRMMRTDHAAAAVTALRASLDRHSSSGFYDLY